jgi:Tfp pilus assembly protein PilF
VLIADQPAISAPVRPQPRQNPVAASSAQTFVQGLETASLAADARNTAVYVNLGLVELATGNLDAAARAFAEGLSIDPAYEPAREALAEVFERQGFAERAARLRRGAERRQDAP